MAGQTNSWEAVLGTRDVSPYGVVEGLVFPIPASGLTVTYLGGIVRLAPTSSVTSAALNTTPGARVGREFAIAGSTKAFTASKDTYVYIANDGTLSYSEQSNGAAKPTLTSLNADLGQYLWKVVTNGTDVTSVTDLRGFAPAFLEHVALGQGSYVTATQGATIRWTAPYRCRVLKVYSICAAALGASDTGTTTFARVADGTATNITGLVVTNAISETVATYKEAIPTLSSNPEFAPGDYLRGTTAKTTTGGAVNLYAVVERLG